MLTLTLADGDPEAQLDAMQTAPLHLTVKLQTTASAASPNRFQIQHLTQSSSRAEDASADLPLSLERQPNVSTGVIQALPQAGDADGDGLGNAVEADVHETDPLDVDTDGDGAGDGLEVNSLGSNPLDTDSDDDGLTDGQEVAIGTSPTETDSDSDSFCDGPLEMPGCTAADNCPAIDNQDQLNGDAFPAGDVCQCGDVTGDGLLSPIDYTRARELVAQRTPSGAAVPERCDVTGDAECTVEDLAVLDRLVSGAPAAIAFACEAYTAP